MPTRSIRPAASSSAAPSARAFTLIEIMIVVLIIGILLSIAVPNFVRARESVRAKSCVENLKKLQWAKDQWAMEFHKNNSDTPTETDLSGSFKYLTSLPVCPSTGLDYTIGSIGSDPTCTLGTLPAPNKHAIP